MPTYDFNGTFRLMMASAKRQPQPKSSISRPARLLMPIRRHMYSSSRNPVSAGGPMARTAGLFRLNFSGTTNTTHSLPTPPSDSRPTSCGRRLSRSRSAYACGPSQNILRETDQLWRKSNGGSAVVPVWRSQPGERGGQPDRQTCGLRYDRFSGDRRAKSRYHLDLPAPFPASSDKLPDG